MNVKPIFFLFAAMAIGACGSDESSPNDPPTTLTQDGKGDISDGVTRLGALEFGGDVEGEFKDDFEVHAYTIAVKGGSDVVLDVTHKGTSLKLDTNMFIYAPTDEGLVRIAKDDDSGFGKHSRIAITLRKSAEFVVVIKPEQDKARGRYRITLDCENGGCALPVDPQASDECPEVIAEDIEECIVETFPLVSDGVPDFPDLIDRCTSPDVAENLHELACQLGDDAFCFEDFENFFIDRLLRNCNLDANEKYHIEQPVELSFTRDIDERGDQLESCSACVLNMNSYEYEGTPDHADLVQSAVAFTDWGVDVSVTEETVDNVRDHIAAELTRRLSNFDGGLEDEVNKHLDEIESAVGPLGDAGLLTGVNAFDDNIFAWAITIPSENKIVVYEIREEF